MNKNIKKGLFITGIIWYLYNRDQTRNFRIKEQKIYTKKINREIRLTHITDYHNHKNMDIKKVVKGIKDFNSELICLTGDMISRNTKNFQPALNLIKGLKTLKIPIFYITGNHEMENPNREEFFKELNNLNIIHLENESYLYKEINITGLSHPTSKKIYEEITENTSENLLNLLLIHSPSDLFEIDTDNSDIILAGHTHGGQVRVPGIGAIIVPSQGFFAKTNKGLYKKGKSQLYIDSGLGNTRLDLRAFNPVQFTNIKIMHR